MDKSNFRTWLAWGLVALLLVVFMSEGLAQCPMCKMSAESNLKDGGTAGKGLNAGILYLLATPYLLVGGMAYLWWRSRRAGSSDSGQ